MTTLIPTTVQIDCHEPACDQFERTHETFLGLEPAVHEIAFHHVGLSKSDGEREWRMWLTNPQDEYTEDEAAQLLRDINAAKALMHDLNRRTDA
jgi:hypothetical protein